MCGQLQFAASKMPVLEPTLGANTEGGVSFSELLGGQVGNPSGLVPAHHRRHNYVEGLFACRARHGLLKSYRPPSFSELLGGDII
ncbi:MAG: hypothetical protein WC935_00030 [Thermoleophilia bacterium]